MGVMEPFDFQPRTRIVFSAGSISRLGDLAISLGCRRALVVSDQGVVAAGHFAAGAESLRTAGLEVSSFHDFGENPTTAMVDAGATAAKRFSPDLLIGLGGGSSLDCCKGINFIHCCGGSMHDYQGVGKVTRDLLPMIAVPTTAGTGSESQSFALISDARTHVKMACGDPQAAFRIALLDPLLTRTQPPRVTALTGIDALSHAIESFVTTRRNALSTMFSHQAFGLLARGFPKVLRDGNDVDARGQMQLGACFAGMAIESSMLGAAHATANPLTARHQIPHGQAVGMMLPAVIRMNGDKHAEWYAELLAEIEPVVQIERAPERLATLIEEYLKLAGMATKLSELAIGPDQISALAEDALKQWTGTFNPIPLDPHRVGLLYHAVV